MVLHELKNMYPDIKMLSSDQEMDYQHFAWYQTRDGEVFGIPKKDLTEKEEKLLDAFLTKYEIHKPFLSDREKHWHDFIRYGQHPPFDNILRYRFIVFQIKDKIDHHFFNEAVQALFPYSMPILWSSDHEGAIIEEITDESQESANFSDVINTFMSDTYTNIRFYISEFFHHVDRAPQHFQWANKVAQKAFPSSQKSVIHYVDAFIYLFLDALSESDRDQMISSLFDNIKDEPELLETVKVFLSCNSNATMASKKLYMHRNSLQYRIEKFIDKTGIDIKSFHGALTTYLVLLLNKQPE